MRAQRTLRNLHRDLHQNSWLSEGQRVAWRLRCLSAKAAPEPRSWVGRVRVVGAADVIDALGAWRVSGSPDFHRDSIEAGSFGTRPRTLRATGGRPMPALPPARLRSRSTRVRSLACSAAPWPRPPSSVAGVPNRLGGASASAAPRPAALQRRWRSESGRRRRLGGGVDRQPAGG